MPLFLEHLNIILFELAQKYHGILCKADITSSDDTFSGTVQPWESYSSRFGQFLVHHLIPVKKELKK
jgi:hypothetical protein